MPVLSESFLPGGENPHAILYVGLGAVVLVLCGAVLRRASRPQPSSSLPQHENEKLQHLSNNVQLQNSWQEKRTLPLSPLATQPPPPYASSPSTFPAPRGLNYSYYASPMELDQNPQSYFDEPYVTSEPTTYSYSSSSSGLPSSEPMIENTYTSEPSSYYPTSNYEQQPLSTTSWFANNANPVYHFPPSSPSSPSSPSFTPGPFTSSPQVLSLNSSPNSSYSSSTSSLPRRRSYTKTTSSGGSVSGEIVTGDMWRRHTRVFGGGVCKACEESEKMMKMHLMGLKMRGVDAPAEVTGEENAIVGSL